jgi:hypothetical protein
MKENSSALLGFGAPAILALVFIALAASHAAAQQRPVTPPVSADGASAIATDAYSTATR